MDNIGVQPQTNLSAVKVATDEIEVNGVKVHYPISKFAIGKDGEKTLISQENPLPMSLSTDLLEAISTSLKINNMYLSHILGYKITEHDIED